MKLNAVPAVTDAGAVTVKWVAAAGVTVIDFVSLRLEFAVSTTVSAWTPAALKVALNVWIPASTPVKV